MNKIRLVFGFSVLLVAAASANAGIVYLDTSAGDLYAGDPTTGQFNFIGNSDATCNCSGGFSDIAFSGSGNLYGLDDNGNLYSINPTNAAASLIGSTGVGGNQLVGLAGTASPTNLWAGGNGAVYRINDTTAAPTEFGGGTQPYLVSGDLEFVGNTLYLTSCDSAGANTDTCGELWQVSLNNGAGTNLGETGFSDVYGMAYDTGNGVLYGYTNVGTEFNINPGNLASDQTLFASISTTGGSGISANDQIFGAAYTTTPEPASMALFGLGLVGMAFATRKRRSA